MREIATALEFPAANRFCPRVCAREVEGGGVRDQAKRLAWNKENAAKLRANRKRWQISNPEKFRAYKRAKDARYRARNLERLRAGERRRAAERRLKNPLYYPLWVAQHPEAVRAYARMYASVARHELSPRYIKALLRMPRWRRGLPTVDYPQSLIVAMAANVKLLRDVRKETR